MVKARTDFPAAALSPQTNEVLHFGSYRLDTQNEQLWRNQQTVRLTGKAFAVLRYLAERPNQLVSKRDLFRAVWPDAIVSQSTLTSCVKELRKALEDDARSPQWIETVHRRGYRFIEKVISSQQSVVSRGGPSGVRSPASEVRSTESPAPNTRHPTPALVGREAELAQLHQWFTQACGGGRRVVFVTGETGIGKTTLLEVFLRSLEPGVQSQKRVISSQQSVVSREKEDRQREKMGVGSEVLGSGFYPFPSLNPQPQIPSPDPWVAWGRCIEQYGAGEPYMPVLEAFGRLCRGAEKNEVMNLLHRHAPTWLVHMPALLSNEERETLQRQVGGATRDRMLREMAEAFEALTVERPFILCLEDLHWSDYSTLELLSALAGRPERARLLVLGTYRSIEALSREHPLKKARQEVQRSGCYRELALSPLSEEDVKHYLVQRFPDGTFPAGMEQIVYHHTEGNPLFVVNVTDYLEHQKKLGCGEGEREPQMPGGTTSGVPESLRQLIKHHIEQMSTEEQEVLMAASTAGMEFSAAAVAAGLGREDEAIEMLCANLASRKQFLQSVGETEWPDRTFVARYRFVHAIYQNVLYEQVPPGRRVSLHRRIGERLERAYQGRLDEVAAELGVHFECGRDFHRAVRYVGQAAQTAMWTYAYREAIDHLDKGIALLAHLPESPERTQQELTLQVGRSLSLMHTRGFADPEVEHAYGRVRDLSHTVGDSPQRFAALWGLRNFHLLRGELQAGCAAAQEFLELVRRTEMSSLAAEAHLGLGTPLFHLGEFGAARPHIEQSLALYNPRLPQPKVFLTGQDPRASSLAHLAVLLWILGYPDQARERSRQALELAQDTAFPYGQALALNLAATLHVCCRDFQTVAHHATSARTFAQECGFVHLMAMGMVLQGWALAMQDKSEEGIALIQAGLKQQRAAGIGIGEVSYQMLLVDAYIKANQVEFARQALTEALVSDAKTRERTFEAELYRLQGELILEQFGVRGWASEVTHSSEFRINTGSRFEIRGSRFKGRNEARGRGLGTNSSPQSLSPKSLDPREAGREAEECFLKAIDIAQKQQAKSLELRAVMSLVRLRQQQASGRGVRSMEQKAGSTQDATHTAQHAARAMLDEARSVLSEVYTWFTEGFDTPDLREARTLLEGLRRVE